MSSTKLKQFLEDHGVWYETMSHAQAYTAPEVAAAAHVPGRELAKTVIVKIDGKLAMAVLPASEQIDFELLQEATGALDIELAREEDFCDVFPDCEVGAMPPFGNLYEIPVYVAESLTQDDLISFNACNHTQLLRMAYRDYARLVRPQVLQMTVRLA